MDVHFGDGYAVALSQDGQTRLELYPAAIRLSMGERQLVLPRSPATIAPEGVVFADERSFLSVGPRGEVLFQYAPDEDAARSRAASPPAQLETKTKSKSERHVGQVRSITTHTTRAGKLVAEVELTVPDPDRPGQPLVVKCAAFDQLAATLRDTYRPGELITAIGIPHELTRTNNQGRHWTERQLYLVRPPKRHPQENH